MFVGITPVAVMLLVDLVSSLVTEISSNFINRVTDTTVDDRQMGHVNQVGHLSKTPLNLLEIHEIGSIDTFESKQQNYHQIWHLWPLYQKLLGLSHFSWLSHHPTILAGTVLTMNSPHPIREAFSFQFWNNRASVTIHLIDWFDLKYYGEYQKQKICGKLWTFLQKLHCRSEHICNKI